MRLSAAVVVASLVTPLAWSGPARAAADCPPGDWFCDEAPPPSAPAPAQPPPGSPDAGPEPLGPDAPPLDEEPEQRDERDRLIRLDVERPEPIKRRRHRRFREWGFGVHFGIGLMGNDRDAHPQADMNGFGASLRFRPIPHIAVEGSLDVFMGTDYNGFNRFEDVLMANALFFANPRSAVQLYGLDGFGGGHAWLDAGRVDPPLADETYSYLGMQAGFGVEARITRRFAIGADLLGFVRGRTDRGARDNPEFVDPVTHRATNTSGGGVLRLGGTLYW
jgi:hypothetical protein